jgi:uncharacterized protein YxeA
MQAISLNEEREIMKTIFSKKAWFVIIFVFVMVIIISLIIMQKASRGANTTAKQENSSYKAVTSVTVPSPVVIASQISKSTGSSQLSSTEIKADVTQSKAAYTVTNSKPTAPVNSRHASTVTVNSSPVSSKANVSSKVSSRAVSSAISSSSKPAPLPPVPTSQEWVTKVIGNNTIKLDVNAFVFEAFVDWSSVQQYLLDDFYVKIYKNGVLKDGPSLYGCVAKNPTNTVTVEIDTYESNGHWYIQPATYTIECYCQLGEHSLIKENRPNIISCPSATFTVSINERGFA